MDKRNCLQKEAGAKKLFATTTTPKKIVCVDEMSGPLQKIMVRPLSAIKHESAARVFYIR
jgi:hypothetical protein